MLCCGQSALYGWRLEHDRSGRYRSFLCRAFREHGPLIPTSLFPALLPSNLLSLLPATLPVDQAFCA